VRTGNRAGNDAVLSGRHSAGRLRNRRTFARASRAYIMISGHATIEGAVARNKLGAFDLWRSRSTTARAVRLSVRNAIERRTLARQVSE